jgi:hypothetical protein
MLLKFNGFNCKHCDTHACDTEDLHLQLFVYNTTRKNPHNQYTDLKKPVDLHTQADTHAFHMPLLQTTPEVTTEEKKPTGK